MIEGIQLISIKIFCEQLDLTKEVNNENFKEIFKTHHY